MRCDEVARMLDLPDADDDLALAVHLAACPACARRSEQAARVGRLWGATRPAEPSPEAWDRVWAAVDARLGDREHGPLPSHRRWSPRRPVISNPASTSSRPWRGLAAIGLVGLAQAAALLLAVHLYWTGDRGVVPAHVASRAPLPPRATASPDHEIQIEAGPVVLIRSIGSRVDVVDLTVAGDADDVDPLFDFLNRAESASSVVAMSE